MKYDSDLWQVDCLCRCLVAGGVFLLGVLGQGVVFGGGFPARNFFFSGVFGNTKNVPVEHAKYVLWLLGL
jgi:hypothetical protein